MSSEELAQRHCVPCKGGVPALEREEIRNLHSQIEGWEVIDDHHLMKTFKFDDFAQALEYVNRIGAMADEEDHHPEIYLTYGKVRIKVWTHAVDGLTENDFIFAAKSDELR